MYNVCVFFLQLIGTVQLLTEHGIMDHSGLKHEANIRLTELFIPGEGSRMVRELFVMAREHAPSIIFMDEIDSIGSTRIESGSGGDSEVG